MKEHTDDSLSSVKESTATVDSTSSDVIVTRKEKIEGIFGEKDDKDDMMVDVVSADASVDDHGATKIESVEKVTPDQVIKDVVLVKEVSDDLVESKVVSLEKVEVVKEVIKENVVKTVEIGSDCDDQKSGNGSVVKDSKMDTEPPKPSSKEPEAGGGETEASEPVHVVADEDEDHPVEEKTQKETEVLISSKIPESIEDRVIAVEEGLVSKDKDEDGVNNQSSLTEVVNEDNARVNAKNTENEDGVDLTYNESLQSTNDAEKSAIGDSNMIVDQMKDEDHVMNEEIVKDEALDSKKIPESPTIVDKVVDHENAENLDQKGEVNDDQISKEENSQSRIEDKTDNEIKSEDTKMDDEPQAVEEEISVKHKNEDPESVSVQDHVMDEKTVKDDVKNSSKISQSLTMANLGLEDVDVVVVDEGLQGKKTQDGVSVELSLVFPENPSSDLKSEVDPKTEVDQKVEADSTCKDDKEPDSDLQALTDGAILVENESIKDNDVTDSSKPDPESSNDKMTPGITDEVVETDTRVQTTKVEPATIGGDSSNIQEDQGLIVNPSNESNEITPSHTGGPHTYGAQQFSYEEAHAVRGEDAGMDIDEVLGWKDESQSEDGSKKRKALEPVSDEAKPLFKVGAVIQKVASQPTGPQGEPADHVAENRGSVQDPRPAKTGNQSDMLSQLHLTAQDPMKGYGFMNTIIPFFKTHRATVLSKSRKRKTSNENDPDEFEFDDVNDSYWTDRIIQNHPEEQPLQENNPTGHQIVAYEQEKPTVKPTRRSNKKRFFSSNHEIEANEQSEIITRRQQNLATEVLMKFAGGVYFPSEIHLNKMFKRFGPLMESETEVDRQSGRARVVFKKCSDAEVAHNSAGKFNIFGSISVNYELNYTPLISYKPLPLPLTQDPTC